MGVTRQGKIAVLTNYLEKKPANASQLTSRGAIVNSWLATPPTDSTQTTDKFVANLVCSNLSSCTGGYSLACGRVNEPLAIVSNRSARLDQISWVATDKGQTIGLSNTFVDDRTWPKILRGEELTKAAIDAHVQAADEDEDQLIVRLLGVLSTDTLPRVQLRAGSSPEMIKNGCKESIFIPKIGVGDEDDDVNKASYSTGPYGTQKQTIILVDYSRRVRYFERTIYDSHVNAIPPGQGDRSFEFVIDDSHS